jgi:hypothetical protein
VADRHTAALWTAGGALISVGGIFMAVTGFEPTKKPSTVWANSWFDVGFAFVVLGAVIVAIGTVVHFRREVPGGSTPPAVDPPPGPAAVTPPVVDSDEFKPYHAESGEFPDGKALTFGFDHIHDHPGAYAALSPRRCTVITPSGVEMDATRHNRYFQYPQEFDNAPAVRPGIYRFKLEGRLASGKWTLITEGEHEVKPPPPLIVTILDDSQFENWKYIALIAALHVQVENTTDMPIVVGGYAWTSPADGELQWDHHATGDEILSVQREIARRDESQQHGQPLRHYSRIGPHQSISGWFLVPVTRKARGGTPACTIIVRDSVGNEYRTTFPARSPQVYGS